MKRKVTITREEIALFEEYLRLRGSNADSILAIDPGSRCTGWATKGASPEIDHGDGQLELIARRLVSLDAHRAWLHCVEQPYSGRGPQAALDDAGQPVLKGPRATPESLWKLGRAMGFLEGSLDSARASAGLKPALTWHPRPGQWRAILDLNPKKRGTSGRAQAAESAWRMARSITGDPLEGPGGGRLVDRAMAICILAAAQRIIRAVEGRPS